MNKINKTSIERIPARKFTRAELMKDGKMVEVNSAEVKKAAGEWTFGGVTPGTLEREASKAGLKGGQFYKRKNLMKVMTGEDEKEKAPVKPEPEIVADEVEADFQPEMPEETAEEPFDEAA